MNTSTLKTLPAIFALSFFICAALFAQEPDNAAEAWYKTMPAKAILNAEGKIKIGGKVYPLYNAFDPIAPKGGERVVCWAGALDFYMWFFRIKGQEWTLAYIDMDLNIYYYDEHTQKYTSPNGAVFEQ